MKSLFLYPTNHHLVFSPQTGEQRPDREFGPERPHPVHCGLADDADGDRLQAVAGAGVAGEGIMEGHVPADTFFKTQAIKSFVR